MTNAAVNLIGAIESGNGATSSNVYQTGDLFNEQFGDGAEGVTNFLSQANAANPNITIGDAYAEYNQGTGTPGSGATYETLAGANPPAYANLNNNLAAEGLSASTPLSSLLDEQGQAVAIPGYPSSPGDQTFSGGISGLEPNAGSFLGIPGLPSPAQNAAGDVGLPYTPLQPGGPLQGAVGTASSFWTQLTGTLGNWGLRLGLGVLGLIFVTLGLVAAVHGEGVGQAAQRLGNAVGKVGK